MTHDYKVKFDLCEVTHRTGLRLMHTAVALVLDAFGREIADKMNNDLDNKQKELTK